MHLYIHVPFCARRCSYCDFAIAVRRTVPGIEFADLIVGEWRDWQTASWWDETGPIETIYFGGGTPSLVEPAELGRIVAAVRADRPVAPAVEITIEANPEDVGRARAAGWAAAGVNRVSLGVQSFSPAVLEWMHRIHGPERPAEAIEALRAEGIGNVSIDLIYAVPEALGRDWDLDLERGLALEPSHLSLYGLTVEDHTPLGRWVDRGAVVPALDQRAADEYLRAHQRLGAAGLRHYEVSNAGRPGFESRHNLAYWRRAPYLGLGPSAHSARGASRWWNQRDWAAYRRTRIAGESAVTGREMLTDGQVVLERIYLGLRTADGIPLDWVEAAEVERLVDAGWASVGGGRVRLTAEGWLRLDAIAGRLEPGPGVRPGDG